MELWEFPETFMFTFKADKHPGHSSSINNTNIHSQVIILMAICLLSKSLILPLFAILCSKHADLQLNGC